MFYLKHLINSLRYGYGWALSVLLIGVSILLLAINYSFLQNKFEKFANPADRSYFHALVAGKANSNIVYQLSKLPSVHKVSIIPFEEFKARLEKLIADLHMALPKRMVSQEYYGLKIIVNNYTSEREINLLKEYLVRLVGKDKVVITPLYGPSSTSSVQNKEVSYLQKYLLPGIAFLVTMLWIFFNYNWINRVNNYYFLLEKYHNRRHLAWKMNLIIVWLIGSVVGLSLFASGIPFELLEIIVVLIFLSALSLLFFSDRRWKCQ